VLVDVFVFVPPSVPVIVPSEPLFVVPTLPLVPPEPSFELLCPPLVLFEPLVVPCEVETPCVVLVALASAPVLPIRVPTVPSVDGPPVASSLEEHAATSTARARLLVNCSGRPRT
jgi:hypothetical protein